MAGKDPRQRLLDAAIDHIATRGVTDLSLRELAAAIGTSHRMLIHHFGGREGLWVEVIRAVEDRQRAAFAEVVPDPEATVGDAMRQLVAARLRPVAVAQRAAVLRALRPGAAGPARAPRSCSTGSSTTGSSPPRRRSSRTACPRRRRGRTRGSGVAVSRGLLLDLLATRNREAVDAAMEAYIALVEARLDGKSGDVLRNSG